MLAWRATEGRIVRRVMHTTNSGYGLRDTANDNNRGWWDKPASWSQWPLYAAIFTLSATIGGIIMGWWAGKL